MVHGRKLENAYKLARAAIYFMPAIAVVVGIYLILFPVENYRYFSSRPNLSKFDPEKNRDENKILFGVFPIQKHRFVDLDMDLQELKNESCSKKNPAISVQKTYRAFLFPEGDPIENKERLRDLVFFENKTKYPNGSLLHLKPTDEVFVVSDGKKILFPGPEIFRAFGYSFDDLVDVDKSALDQFPNADNRVFLWTHPHPDGTIFQGFPSHALYLVADGKKRRVENADLLKEVWPDFHAVAVDDSEIQKSFFCETRTENLSGGKIACDFDSQAMPESIGGYYYFSVEFPKGCDIENIRIREAEISFIAEKSYATAKDSLRSIFASILNRYIYKQTS